MVWSTASCPHIAIPTLTTTDENIRIEPEVIKRLGREDVSVRIPGDDGYIGTINVYHELHCLVGVLSGLGLEHMLISDRNDCINTCTRRSIGRILTTFKER